MVVELTQTTEGSKVLELQWLVELFFLLSQAALVQAVQHMFFFFVLLNYSSSSTPHWCTQHCTHLH